MNNLYLIYVIDNMIEDVEDSKLDLMLILISCKLKKNLSYGKRFP